MADVFRRAYGAMEEPVLVQGEDPDCEPAVVRYHICRFVYYSPVSKYLAVNSATARTVRAGIMRRSV